MIKSESLEGRSFPLVEIQADLVIAGGGLSGICAAITAARQGLTVALAHDRSVLGGNASSEIRLWILGATSHMGNNNRWAREGGVVATCRRATHWTCSPSGYIISTVLCPKFWMHTGSLLYLSSLDPRFSDAEVRG